MTFDLGVWCSLKPMSASLASQVYGGLCRGEPPLQALVSSKGLAAFYQELTATWPEPSTANRRQKDIDTPWAGPLQHTDAFVLLSCEWIHAEIAFAYVQALAGKHGLTVFDPQSEEVYQPGAEP